VQDLFTAIARRYDLINDLQSLGLHRRWKRRVIRLAGVQAGSRALDLCCGTGDLTYGLAACGARTLGLDFVGPMLAEAVRRGEAGRGVAPRRREPVRGKPSSATLVSPTFIRADALQLPFPDAQFDAITVGYGLRNLADFEAGLREMLRVAKPGGRVVVLDFGKPDGWLLRTVYFGYLRLVVPLFGLGFCGSADAYRYILESLQTYPAQHGVAALMSKLGFVQVRVVNLLGGVMSINLGERPGSSVRHGRGAG
jgi:demethylmenaquinone methyltransferase/2-methoxy-6-polyprenyl-1,4-benzoquinol methylase